MVTQPKKTEVKRLIKKLREANVCCFKCGRIYGHVTAGCSSLWEGQCNVCGKTDIITETRDYGYLAAGVQRLLLELNTLE